VSPHAKFRANTRNNKRAMGAYKQPFSH